MLPLEVVIEPHRLQGSDEGGGLRQRLANTLGPLRPELAKTESRMQPLDESDAPSTENRRTRRKPTTTETLPIVSIARVLTPVRAKVADRLGETTAAALILLSRAVHP